MYWTALMYACNNGHTDVVKVLIDAGADLDIYDKVNEKWVFVEALH